MLPLVLGGTLPWFIADEWITRGPATPRLCGDKIVPAGVAGAGDQAEPAAAVFPHHHFAGDPRVLYRVRAVQCLVLRATAHPLPALANALSLAWAIAATFPMVAV